VNGKMHGNTGLGAIFAVLYQVAHVHEQCLILSALIKAIRALWSHE
jgi:hypothetical protein